MTAMSDGADTPRPGLCRLGFHKWRLAWRVQHSVGFRNGSWHQEMDRCRCGEQRWRWERG